MTFKRWLPTFLAFPIGGYAATELIGSVHDVPSALAGGVLAGGVIGAAQAKALGSVDGGRRWAVATALAMAVGTAAGAATTQYGTEMVDVMLVGAITGASIGAAQAPSLRRGRIAASAWVLTSSLAWTLGWAVTANVIVDIERGFTVFGASGAIVATVITGLMLRAIQRRPRITKRSAAAVGSTRPAITDDRPAVATRSTVGDTARRPAPLTRSEA